MYAIFTSLLAAAAVASPLSYVALKEDGSMEQTNVASSKAENRVISDSSYQDLVVLHHKVHRANHSVDALEWSDSIYADAKTIAQRCKFAHDTMGKYGQNIAAGADKNSIGGVISGQFYNGEVNHYEGKYGQSSPQETDGGFGHFTQVVWKDTTQVACYTADCSATGIEGIDPSSGIPPYNTVCNYLPPGNYADDYKDNVLESKKQPTIDGDYTGDLTITYE